MFFINAPAALLGRGLVKSFHVDSFWSAFWGALVISIVSIFLNITDAHRQLRNSRSAVAFPRRRAILRPDDGGGPIIDV